MTLLRSLLFETSDAPNLDHALPSTVKCITIENDIGTLLLTTDQTITDKTKSYLIKWQHYWFHVKPKNSSGTLKIETMTQDPKEKLDCYKSIRFIYQDWLFVCDDMWEGELKSGKELTLSGL